MRGEVRLDRDTAVFDVSLHDGQYSVHVVRARFLQVPEGHVKVVGKHVLRSDIESEAMSARSAGVFEQEASHNVCQNSALGLGLGDAEVHEEAGEDFNIIHPQLTPKFNAFDSRQSLSIFTSYNYSGIIILYTKDK
jgi:hypothetical protein